MYRPLCDGRRLAAPTKEVWGEPAAPRNEVWGGVRQGECRCVDVSTFRRVDVECNCVHRAADGSTKNEMQKSRSVIYYYLNNLFKTKIIPPLSDDCKETGRGRGWG